MRILSRTIHGGSCRDNKFSVSNFTELQRLANINKNILTESSSAADDILIIWIDCFYGDLRTSECIFTVVHYGPEMQWETCL